MLHQFSRNVSEARKLYRKFVLEAIGEGHREEYYEVLAGRFLGGGEFAEQTKAKAESPGYARMKIKAEAFLKAACAVLNKKREGVLGRSGKGCELVKRSVTWVGLARSCP